MNHIKHWQCIRCEGHVYVPVGQTMTHECLDSARVTTLYNDPLRDEVATIQVVVGDRVWNSPGEYHNYIRSVLANPHTIRITYTKENSMSKIDNLLAQAKHIESLVEKELAKTAEFGVDEYEDDTVIAFEYQFVPDGIFYSYVMIKVNGRWYTSGPRSAGRAWTWDELVEWWAKGKRRQAFIVGQWDEL